MEFEIYDFAESVFSTTLEKDQSVLISTADGRSYTFLIDLNYYLGPGSTDHVIFGMGNYAKPIEPENSQDPYFFEIDSPVYAETLFKSNTDASTYKDLFITVQDKDTCYKFDIKVDPESISKYKSRVEACNAGDDADLADEILNDISIDSNAFVKQFHMVQYFDTELVGDNIKIAIVKKELP